MTSNISPSIKQKYTDSKFNNGYVILFRFTKLFKPTGDAKFMQLFEDFYIINYKSIFNYLIHIKLFDEHIKATKIELIYNKQILLYLFISILEQYQHLARIWSMINNISWDPESGTLF